MDCDSCVKAITEGRSVRRKVVGCIALNSNRYPFRRYGRCWAYSDDPGWHDRYRDALDDYRQLKEGA